MEEFALVLNAGSSSLKFAVFRATTDPDWPLIARGNLEGIGTAPKMSARDAAGESLPTAAVPAEVRDAGGALEHVFAWLRASFSGGRIIGVGHRVVHGGPRYAYPAIVTPEVLTELRRLIPYAPLHQPYNLAAIEAVAKHRPEVPQVACFDTSFHRTLPQVAKLIALPADVRQGGIERYGFHGLSYEYIASVLPQVAPQIAEGRVIVAHLGSGASLCALRAGRSIESTMGFTALDGLCMGTRPGAVDPGVILYLFQGLGLSVKEVETILYKKSGLLGISGVSNDMRDLLESSELTARLAVDYFVYRVTKEVGALAAVLGGIDALVFTAGIGENSPEIRCRVCAACAWLGIEFDLEANTAKAACISRKASAVSVWVIPTNEELMIARHTGRLLASGGTRPSRE
ncbi:MAG TPA: acetate/propionate family kinase [Steroidobacteraceae bacterium]|nr:acetate/propionate family kinase [Steroidobacteraceae bacterium]